MKRRNALASALAQRCDGIRHGEKLGHLRPNPAGEAARRWTITPKRFLPWWRSKTTGRRMRSLRRCASTGYPEAARRCFVFWSVAALRTKKVLHASEQEREDVARGRRRWIREQGLLDSTHLVFIDETSVNTSMTRAYGRGLEGERVIGRVPFAAWKTLTFVAALRCEGMTAPMLIKGAMNVEVFQCPCGTASTSR